MTTLDLTPTADSQNPQLLDPECALYRVCQAARDAAREYLYHLGGDYADELLDQSQFALFFSSNKTTDDLTADRLESPERWTYRTYRARTITLNVNQYCSIIVVAIQPCLRGAHEELLDLVIQSAVSSVKSAVSPTETKSSI